MAFVVAFAFAAPMAFNPVGSAGAVGAGDHFLRLLKEVMPGYSSNSSAITGWPAGPHGPYTIEGGWPIYSETSAYCVVMWLSGKAVAGPGTLVVEMGTLLGHSSRCLASGLELRQDVAQLRKAAAESLYLAFDFFRSVPSPAKKLFRDAEAARASLWLPFWLNKPHHPVLAAVQHASGASSRGYDKRVWGALMVDPVYHGPHRAVPGDIGKVAPATLATFAPEVPIEVFSIDSAKSHDQFINQAASVWPRLRVGSVIHLLDFVKHQLHFFIAEFVLPGHVEVAYASFFSSCWSFVVRKAPLDWARVRRFSFASRTAAQWAAVASEIDAIILRQAANFRPPPSALADLQRRVRNQHRIKLGAAALGRMKNTKRGGTRVASKTFTHSQV
jgi:hypothetical protein